MKVTEKAGRLARSKVLCECGCGEPAPLAKTTNRRAGHIKGQPVRFVAGHNARLQKVSPFDDRWVLDGSGCWMWTGGITGSGYAAFTTEGRTISAHRHAYERKHGRIPSGHQLHHLCEQRSCVNPAHLVCLTPRRHLRLHDNVTSRNARKTHCKRGHRFTASNTYRTSNGGRECYTCKRMHWRRNAARRK